MRFAVGRFHLSNGTVKGKPLSDGVTLRVQDLPRNTFAPSTAVPPELATVGGVDDSPVMDGMAPSTSTIAGLDFTLLPTSCYQNKPVILWTSYCHLAANSPRKMKPFLLCNSTLGEGLTPPV